MSQKQRDQLTHDDLLHESKSVSEGDADIIGYFEVPRGMSYELGYGALEGQHSAEGRIYADIKDDGNSEVDGTLIFQALNPQKEHRANIKRLRTTATRTDLSDRQKQLPFPRVDGEIRESAYLAVAFRSDTDATIERDNCEILIDVTAYDRR